MFLAQLITQISDVVIGLFAKDAGAILKIDRMVLVDLDVFDQYLESFRVK